jgi:hypothetical protein
MGYVANAKTIIFVAVGIVGAETNRSVFADGTKIRTRWRNIGITNISEERLSLIVILGGYGNG